MSPVKGGVSSNVQDASGSGAAVFPKGSLVIQVLFGPGDIGVVHAPIASLGRGDRLYWVALQPNAPEFRIEFKRRESEAGTSSASAETFEPEITDSGEGLDGKEIGSRRAQIAELKITDDMVDGIYQYAVVRKSRVDPPPFYSFIIIIRQPD